MTTHTYSDDIISDLHKDARGFRPSEYFWEEWTQSPACAKQIIWDQLCDELERNMAEEARQQAKAIARLHNRINDTKAIGAANTVEALKWIFEADELSDYDLAYGKSFVCYHYGLPYSCTEFPIETAINEMMATVA